MTNSIWAALHAARSPFAKQADVNIRVPGVAQAADVLGGQPGQPAAQPKPTQPAAGFTPGAPINLPKPTPVTLGYAPGHGPGGRVAPVGRPVPPAGADFMRSLSNAGLVGGAVGQRR